MYCKLTLVLGLYILIPIMRTHAEVALLVEHQISAYHIMHKMSNEPLPFLQILKHFDVINFMHCHIYFRYEMYINFNKQKGPFPN